MTDPMLVIVPTRGRPQNIVRLEKALAETDTLNAHVLYAVDPDDPELEGYLDLDLSRIFVLKERLRLGRTLNFLARRYADQYDVIGFMGDDHVPRTTGWEDRILEVFTMMWGAERHGGPPVPPPVVYGNDLLQGQALPTAVFMDARIIRALTYMVPAEIVHLYADNFWKSLGEELGSLVYLPDVVIEHIHPAAGKVAMDAGYQEVNSRERDSMDRHAWERYRDESLSKAVERIRRYVHAA